jgi:mono/diheme cytochrome c family protein
MADDDVPRPDSPEPGRKTEQQIFDEQIARASGKVVVMFGGLGILAALVISTVALVIAANKSTTTVRIAATPAPGQSTGGGQTSSLTGDALGAQLFTAGKPETGAIGCGSCHTMQAAGATGTIGPNLDKELTADPASATRESIVDPNKEIVPGYSANVMPTNYGKALTSEELDALVNYVYHSTNTKAKAKRASAKPSATP